MTVRRQIDNTVDPPAVGECRAAMLDKYSQPSEDKSGSLLWLDPGNAVNCANGAPPTKCANPRNARALQCTMLSSPSAPAKRVTAVLTDVPGWGNAYLATLEWIDAQRQAAVKAREGGASKPRL